MLDDIKFVTHNDPNDILGQFEREYRDKKGLEEYARLWRADSLISSNLAKQLAEFMAGKSIVIIGENKKVLEKWRQFVGSVAANVIFTETVLDERLKMMWVSHPPIKTFAIIQLGGGDEFNQKLNQMNKSLSGKWPHPKRVDSPEELVDQESWLEFLGAMSATYLAILNGITPKKS